MTYGRREKTQVKDVAIDEIRKSVFLVYAGGSDMKKRECCTSSKECRACAKRENSKETMRNTQLSMECPKRKSKSKIQKKKAQMSKDCQKLLSSVASVD